MAGVFKSVNFRSLAGRTRGDSKFHISDVVGIAGNTVSAVTGKVGDTVEGGFGMVGEKIGAGFSAVGAKQVGKGVETVVGGVGAGLNKTVSLAGSAVSYMTGTVAGAIDKTTDGAVEVAKTTKGVTKGGLGGITDGVASIFGSSNKDGIALQNAASGKFVAASRNVTMSCNRGDPGRDDECIFEVTRHKSDSTASFKSCHGRTLNSTKGGRLICDVRALFMNVSKGARFKIFEHGAEGTIAIQSAFGFFVTVENMQTGQMRANKYRPSTQAEQFYVIDSRGQRIKWSSLGRRSSNPFVR